MYKKKGDLNHTAWLFLSLNAEYFLPKGSFLLSFFFFLVRVIFGHKAPCSTAVKFLGVLEFYSDALKISSTCGFMDRMSAFISFMY